MSSTQVNLHIKTKALLIFTLGRYDLDLITGYKCKNCCNVCPDDYSIKKVVASGFWPGTPVSHSQLFSQELFEYWDIMQKRMPGVSERSFVLGLQDFSSNKNRVNFHCISILYNNCYYLCHRHVASC